MSDWIIPLYKIYSDDEDVNLVTKIIKRGTYWAIGPEIEEFENALRNYLGVDYCVAMNSGTSALHATLLAHNVKTNDEVIVPSFSFISTANSVLFVNANPRPHSKNVISPDSVGPYSFIILAFGQLL